jgi:hypothetical protein
VNRWLFNKDTVDKALEHVMIRLFAAVKEGDTLTWQVDRDDERSTPLAA